jgi:hypothetical protein
VSWDGLIAFVQREDPALISSMKGIAPAEIASLEADYQLDLPEHYRRFLLLMGDDSGGFHLFGPGQNHRFADLRAVPLDESFPAHFLRIAVAVDDSVVTRLDHFLDLSRSDGTDAPIVMFPSDEEFDAEAVLEKGFTLVEQAQRRLFAHLADHRAPERTLVTIEHDADQGPSSLDDIVAVLGRMRFGLAVESLPRVACLLRSDVWALAAAHLGGRGFAVSLWSVERSALEAASDQLVMHFPRATVQNRGRLRAR